MVYGSYALYQVQITEYIPSGDRTHVFSSGLSAATAVTQEGLKDGGSRGDMIWSWRAIVLRSNLGNLEIGTSASAWKTATPRVSNGKYTEKIQ